MVDVIIVTAKRNPAAAPAAAPTTLDLPTNLEDLSKVVIPPIIEDVPCRIKRDKQADENEAKDGSPLAASIRALIKTIETTTDCASLQLIVKSALNGMREQITNSLEVIQEKLGEINPILTLPLNPAKIPKWLKKFMLGRVLPDLEATINQIKRVAELIKALTDLVKVVDEVTPKLEACAIATKRLLKEEFDNEIEQAISDAKKSIKDAIAEAICEGLNELGVTANQIEDILSGPKAIQDLLDSTDQFKRTVDAALDSNLKSISDNQSLVQEITGIPPVIDASSIDALIATSSGPAYDQYKAQVQAVLELPEPVNSVLPAITGTAIVGQTLTCSNGTWTANGVVNTFALTHQWMRQGQEIFGANTYQYIPALDDVDYPVYCKVTAENQTNIEEVFTANTAPVQFALAGGNAPVITGTALSGQTLVCSEGIWPFTTTSAQYEWIRVVQPGANVRVQSLSGNNTYYVKTADIGNSIKCKVVVSSFRYSLSADSANTQVVIA